MNVGNRDIDVDDVPVIRYVVNAGARDRVFDLLLVLGPVFIAIIALDGRTVWSTALAAAYVLAFVGYLLYKGARFRTGARD
ncbi:MAG: hypothetical protein ABEJ28_01910 [Salinigranum sp.]